MIETEICTTINIPIISSKLEKAIQNAKDAWFCSERANDCLQKSEENVKQYLIERDNFRRECGRQLKIACDEFKKTYPNQSWLEWAPAAIGWSRATIARRMQDFANPDAADNRRENQKERTREYRSVSHNGKCETEPAATPPPSPSPTPPLPPTPIRQNEWQTKFMFLWNSAKPDDQEWACKFICNRS